MVNVNSAPASSMTAPDATSPIRIFNPALDFDSGAQEPGETVQIAFPRSGSFLVFCGIHPKMELYVDVTR